MKQNSGNRSENRYKGGRPVKSATIKEGDGLMISHVMQDSTADLGRGTAVVTKIGTARLITIPQEDGSEIRILVP